MKQGVVLLGYYGFGNLGDELLCQAFCHKLKAKKLTPIRLATADLSTAPLGTEPLNRWSLRQLWRACGQSKWLIFGGGGLFQDVTSWKNCCYYALVFAMAKIRGCQTALLGQSVGPVTGVLGKILTRWVYRNADLVCVRDQRSVDLLRQWGVESLLAEDFVLSLDFQSERSTKSRHGLLVNLRPWKDQNLVVSAARSAQKLAQETGRPLHGVALSQEDYDLMSRLDQQGILSLDSLTLLKAEQIQSVYDLGDWALGMRLHFGVLAFLCGCEASMVAYDPKVEAFATRWGGGLWSETDPQPQKFAKAHQLAQRRLLFEQVISKLEW